MTRPAGVEGRWPQEEAGHCETGAGGRVADHGVGT